MTTDDYITTTGERWRKRFGHSIERVLEGDPVSDADILAELRALRAQRDELQGQLQCAGIISDHAIKLDDDRQSWKHKARELEKQRDELLAALEGVVRAVDGDLYATSEEWLSATNLIKRAKGEA